METDRDSESAQGAGPPARGESQAAEQEEVSLGRSVQSASKNNGEGSPLHMLHPATLLVTEHTQPYGQPVSADRKGHDHHGS